MAGQFHLEDQVSARVLSGRVFTAATDANTVLSAAQTVNGIVTMTPGANPRNLTPATAATIVAAIPDVQVDTTFELTVMNVAAATNAIAMQTASGVTYAGVAANATVAAATQATFLGRVTNVATPTVIFYRKG
jgi:phosphoribosylanthranilate isomerase